MGIFDKVSEITSTGNPPFGRSVVSGASDDSSTYKVPKEGKGVKKEASVGNPNEVAIIETVRLNEGVYRPDKVESSKVTPADYYRRGRIKPPRDGETGAQTTNIQYDYNPRFLQDPENEEVASIRLIGKPKEGSKSQPIDLIPPYSKFFLESYQEGHMERSQIVETFGDFYVFFFGERPPVYTFTGTLLNTKDINWKEDFMFYYENFLRGTKTVEYKAKVLLTYNLSQIEGFVLGVNMSAQAANDKGVQVSFQVLVTDRRSMRLSLDFGIVEDNGRFNEDRSIITLLTQGVSNQSTSNSVSKARDTMMGKLPPATTAKLDPKYIDGFKKATGRSDFSIEGGKVLV
jgi:hypothetical protein